MTLRNINISKYYVDIITLHLRSTDNYSVNFCVKSDQEKTTQNLEAFFLKLQTTVIFLMLSGVKRGFQLFLSFNNVADKFIDWRSVRWLLTCVRQSLWQHFSIRKITFTLPQFRWIKQQLRKDKETKNIDKVLHCVCETLSSRMIWTL